jgi:hypothetical protein
VRRGRRRRMDKYGMFKNFMHNELGITKEDIRLWVREAVSEEARRLIVEPQMAFSVEKVVENVIWDKKTGFGQDALKEDIKRAVVSALVKRIEVKVESKESPTHE